MLRDSKGLKITLLVIVLVVMFVNFLPGDTYSAKQEVTASVQDGYDLAIKAVAGDVSVTIDPAATRISASYSGSGRTRSKLVLEQSGSKVTISEKYSEKGFLRFFDFSSTPRMMVVIPQDTALKSLTASTVSGDIDIETNLIADMIKLSSTSGGVDFLNLEAPDGTVQISSVSGNVDGYLVAADKVKISMTSGNAEVYRMEGKNIELTSVSGNINGEAAPGNGDMKLSTVSGEIDVILDTATNATVTAKTLSGSLHLGNRDTDGQWDKESASAVIGDGTGAVEAKTTSGPITISW